VNDLKNYNFSEVISGLFSQCCKVIILDIM